MRETGRPVTIKDEGVSLHENVSSIDFVGGGVDGSVIGDDITEAIPGASGADGNAETPTGLINGVNTVFTLAQTPSPASSLRVFLNRTYMTAGGEDYTLVDNTITFINAPRTGSILRVFYTY